ncbi:tripartite tricarboxylate transporter substrate-binding protein [Roseococcus sp.]|uniref:tripartite tricarboxylate transporter substrate-binding protein n=1 Tax=Roseococcus sp. TaxID=2109646 RepID=UPI003BAC912A
MHRPIRRRSLALLSTASLAAPALAASTLAAPALAQSGFPARAVRIIVPYAPGGASDIVGRLVAQHATRETGQSFVIENRAGGATVPGMQAVATAPADGYTVSTVDNALSVNPTTLRGRLPFDTEKDLTPLGVLVQAPVVFVKHPSAPAESVADVLAMARQRPGSVSLAHAGIGSPNHLAMVQFLVTSGLEMTPVGYRGGGPELAALVGGEIQYGFISVPSSLAQLQAGRVKALAITSQGRSPLLPEVPSFREAGLPAVDQLGWWGMVAPAGVPEAVLDRLHALLVASVHAPEVAERLRALNYELVGGSRADFAALIRLEIARWADMGARGALQAE